jgi:hypothetical protein
MPGINKITADELTGVADYFNVVQFFEDDTYEYVRRGVTDEEAVLAAKHYCTSVGARMGFVKRVIITDMLDNTNFEWVYGKGVVFPPREGTPSEH